MFIIYFVRPGFSFRFGSKIAELNGVNNRNNNSKEKNNHQDKVRNIPKWIVI